MNYPEIIKKLRAKLLVTQTELSELLGCSFSSVNRWEKVRHEPTMKAKRKIMQLCRENNIEVEMCEF